MWKRHDKLVRDKVPQLIRESGGACATTTMESQDYIGALGAKLVEEAQEAAGQTGDALIGELADLYEVIDSLLATHGISTETVLDAQRQKRAERGGFGERICLLWSD